MQKIPVPLNENDRLKALKSYQILDTLPEEEFDRITSLASIICNVPISLISLIDDKRQWFKSKVGLTINETSKDIAFCSYAILDDQLLEVEDASKDIRFKANPLVTGQPNFKFYAGYPLIDGQGMTLGTLCVIDNVPKKLDENQKQALKLLSKSVTNLITTQRRNQELEQFENLFDLSEDIICVLNKHGYFEKINHAFNKVLGWDDDEIFSLTIFQLLHPEDVESLNNKLETQFLEGKPTLNFTHRFRCKNGVFKYLQWVANTEKASGNLFAIARDISAERYNEQLIFNSENKFKSFFENSQGLMCTHDLNGKFLSVNYSGANSLGYTLQEILALSLFDIVPKEYHVELNNYLEVSIKKGSANGIMHTTHKNGTPLIWLFSNVIENDIAGTKYIIGNAIDITERHQLEVDLKRTKEMLEQTNEVAKIGAWEVDFIREKIFWSNVTKIIHEVPDDFELTIEIAISFYQGKNKDLIVEAVKQATENGKSYDIELQIITAKGKKLWVRAIGTPEFKDNICTRIYGTFQDIDNFYQQNSKLKTAKILAEQGSLAKSEFLANMSHEIRTPLNGVIGFTDLVLKTSLNSTQHQYLSIVNQSANSLLNIINDILDFSKIEAGKLELDIDKIDIYELSSQAVDIITFQVQNKGLEILLNLAPNLPRFIHADAMRLKQVIVNLLSNAAKFTEKGEIELKIERLNKTKNGNINFKFEVRDTGIGIKPDKQIKIFEAFSQEDASTTKKYGGTGLGLTISNKLLGLMGSKLQLKSIVNQGSCFYFELNLKTEQGESIIWENLEEIKKVLIVDDNEKNRVILKQIFTLKKIKVEEAKNGLDALQLLAQGKKYDVILMDYHMPLMDGIETIKKIRENLIQNDKDSPIILLHSSSDDEQIIKACNTLQINQALVKPIKMQELYFALNRLHQKTEVIIESVKPEKIAHHTVNILIVEDNPVNKLLVKTIVKRIAPNAIIFEALNGLEAIKLFSETNPDIVLMDIQMPEMNGYEATKKIRALHHHSYVPIIALTAANVKGEKEKCIAVGMDDFITKPFVEETIIAVFNKWLHLSDSNKNASLNQTTTTPEHNHFDVQIIKEYLDDDPNSLREVLNLIISDVKRTIALIKEQALKKDLIALNASGHKLYGTVASAGMNELAKLARELEYLKKFSKLKIDTLMGNIELELNAVMVLVQKAIIIP